MREVRVPDEAAVEEGVRVLIGIDVLGDPDGERDVEGRARLKELGEVRLRRKPPDLDLEPNPPQVLLDDLGQTSPGLTKNCARLTPYFRTNPRAGS